MRSGSKRAVLNGYFADQSNPVAVIDIGHAMHRAQRLDRRAVGPMPAVNGNASRRPGQQVGDHNILLVAGHQFPQRNAPRPRLLFDELVVGSIVIGGSHLRTRR